MGQEKWPVYDKYIHKLTFKGELPNYFTPATPHHLKRIMEHRYAIGSKLWEKILEREDVGRIIVDSNFLPTYFIYWTGKYEITIQGRDPEVELAICLLTIISIDKKLPCPIRLKAKEALSDWTTKGILRGNKCQEVFEVFKEH